MSGTKNCQIGRWDRERQAAMSFTEIGNALGISRRSAYIAYSSGIWKLKARPKVLTYVASLANELDQERRGEYE